MNSYDLIVIGGGMVGIHASLYADQLGLKTLLIDKGRDLGGHMRFIHHQLSAFEGKSGQALLAEALDLLEKSTVEVLKETAVTAVYEDHIITTISNERYQRFQAKALLITTGSYQRGILFENNDLPQVYGLITLLELIFLYGVIPGKKAIVVGDSYLNMIEDYLNQAGIQVVKKIHQDEVKKAFGTEKFEGIITKDNVRYEGDFLVTSTGLLPHHELLNMAGCQFEYDQAVNQWFVQLHHHMTSIPGIFASGNVVGAKKLDDHLLDVKEVVNEIQKYVGDQP